MGIFSILVAALVSFIIGFLFHGPLFGKTWMRLANIHPTGKEKLSDMWRQMLLNYISNVVMAGVLGAILWFTASFMGPFTWYRAAIFAVWIWLGFIVTSSTPDVIWMGKSWKLWLFEITSSLFAIVGMAIVLVLL